MRPIPHTLIFICTAMLFIAPAHLPYGFYTLLRLTIFAVFLYVAYIAYEQKFKYYRGYLVSLL